MNTYKAEHISASSLLTKIQDGQIAIPEIQRPFVWNATKVRDLIDSMYQGFPIGYIITWSNPETRLKDGSFSRGKSIIIDGQQRIMAMASAIAGKNILNKEYKKKRIVISFNPLDETFAVCTPALINSKKWISDISTLFKPEFNIFEFVKNYTEELNSVDTENQIDALKIGNILTGLLDIKNIEVGVIELSDEIDLDVVTEIFTRINSKGVSLSQNDFVMSKIATSSEYDGINIRKCIDYFCHILSRPEDFENIKNNDKEFLNSELFTKMEWISEKKNFVYLPDYADVIKTVFVYKFKRGLIKQLVQLLSGRDFNTKENREEIVRETFNEFKFGVIDFCNKNNFENYSMILKSMGIIDLKLIKSINTLNFGYALYLLFHSKGLSVTENEHLVKRFIMLSILTQRFSGSTESQFDHDIRLFNNENPQIALKQLEESILGDTFWEHTLVDKLKTSQRGTFFNIFLISQIYSGDVGFLSNSLSVKNMIEMHGDIHHIFPKNYLIKNNINDKSDYNQIANYALVQKEVNIRISDESPKDYLKLLDLSKNDSKVKEMFYSNAVPLELFDLDYTNYDNFLDLRRNLMSQKIKKYFYDL